MSSNLPPSGPPTGPPTGPPSGPGPEYLDSHGGGPFQPPPAAPRGGRRTGLIAGGVIAAAVLVGGGAWAAWSFFSTGPQPAEALPDSTVAYLSIDLDPSGGQKIEALRTLRKFPAFKEEVGLDADDDVRERIFEEIQQSAPCDDLDYRDDIEPWLGDRMAVAAVDNGGDTPVPVLVLQVSDQEAADAGLEKLQECGGGDGGAWAIDGDWALIGESQDELDDIAADAAESPLSEDDAYATWTGEAGDAGIVSAYVAPAAGELLAENLDGFTDQLGGLEAGLAGSTGSTDGPVPPELTEALEDFEGMAATVRFDDGALEIEVAAGGGGTQEALTGSDRGDDVLATLPDDTAAAFGVGLADGWFGDAFDQLSGAMGGDVSADELLDQLSEQSGLDLPDDVETLTGESAAIAVGGDFDPRSFTESGDGSDVPIGLKVKGDPDAIDDVLDKLRPQVQEEDYFLDSDSDGDMIAIGPDPGYREELLEDGGLGDSDVFENVVREADDAAAILFVNFDSVSDWVTDAGVMGDDQEVADNLEPLQGLGMSSWFDGDASHLVLRVTTD